jgi:hypothetical protein
MAAEPYRPASVNARVATVADLPAVAETMAGAFYDDPVWGWAFPNPEQRLQQHRVVWRFAVESALDYGWVWLTEGCASASLWRPLSASMPPGPVSSRTTT